MRGGLVDGLFASTLVQLTERQRARGMGQPRAD
jgi:hypothetical protein